MSGWKRVPTTPVKHCRTRKLQTKDAYDSHKVARISCLCTQMLRQHRTHITTWIVPITCVRHCCTSTLQIRESPAVGHQWDVFALSSEERESDQPIELENGSAHFF